MIMLYLVLRDVRLDRRVTVGKSPSISSRIKEHSQILGEYSDILINSASDKEARMNRQQLLLKIRGPLKSSDTRSSSLKFDLVRFGNNTRANTRHIIGDFVQLIGHEPEDGVRISTQGDFSGTRSNKPNIPLSKCVSHSVDPMRAWEGIREEIDISDLAQVGHPLVSVHRPGG
jgi:hypothetical protein